MYRLCAPVSGALADLLVSRSASPAPLLTRSELARWLNVSVRHTYKLEECGLRRVDLEGPVRFDPQTVAAFVTERMRRRGEAGEAPMQREVAPDQAAAVWPRGGSGTPARIGLARVLPSESIRSLAPKLQAQSASRARRGGRP